jgi:hypothetical protein
MISQYFMGNMMPEWSYFGATLCERFGCDRDAIPDGRSKAAGKCTKMKRFACILWANGREDALSCAQQRARHAPTEVKVLDAKWNVAKVIPAASGQSLI